jgi:hypothetical protein
MWSAAALCACLALTGLWAERALGAVGHEFRGRITEAAGNSLEQPGATTVDQASGDVFVTDPGAGVVDVYSASGAYLTQFGEGKLTAVGVAVAERSGLVYVADSFEDAVVVYKPTGTGGYELLSEWSGEQVPGEAFGEVAGVAVDNSTGESAGDVYVVDSENSELGKGAVYVYKPKASGSEEGTEGQLVRTLTAGGMEQPNGAAVSARTGKLYVADSAAGDVYEFSAAGAEEGKPLTGASSPQGKFAGAEGEEEGNVSAIGLDETTGDLLVAESERHVVSEFGPPGEWVGWITSTPNGPLAEPHGVGVGPSGDVYVADTGERAVDLFGAGVLVPDVLTKNASKLARTEATLNGTIDGDGEPAHYRFEWGASEALGTSTPAVSAGTGEEKASTQLKELKAGASYYYRVVGENENGANDGAIKQFTTLPAVDGVSTGEVQDLVPTGATVTGSLAPNGTEAFYEFEYGLTASFGEDSPQSPVDAGSASETITASTELGDLTPNTTYHYRIVASNSYGVTYGEDATFTTPGAPRITDEPVSGIGHETAILKAKIDPDELASEYHFEYGPTTAYGTEVPLHGETLAAGDTPIAVSQSLSGLKLGVTYHYRLVASNSAGVSDGPDQTFTTIPPALITSESAAEVSATAATLQTEVNPLGNDTSYYFQYGTQPCQPDPGACVDTTEPPGTDLGSGESPRSGSVRVQGLQPGTSYYYRVLATNILGTGEGTEHVFTTQAAAAPLQLPDHRAWEMVSPPDKQGAPVEALTREGGIILSSESGDTFTYVVNGALDEQVQGNRSPEWQQVIARREAGGWRSEDVATPSSRAKGVDPGQTPEYQYFTPELSAALVEPAQFGPNAEPPLASGVTQATMYVRDDLTGEYLPLLTEADVEAGVKFGGATHFVSATPDLSHVVISSAVALKGSSSAPGLYEWSGGQLQLVSILPDGLPAKGLIELGYSHVQAGAVSTDGSRVIFTTVEEEPHLGHLYMRDSLTGQTVQLDAAQGAIEPTGRGTARFQTASANGSRVFFTDRQRLTANSNAEPITGKANLYECEMVEEAGRLACRLNDLSAVLNTGEHANVKGLLLATSEAGTSTYFVAQGELAANQNGNGESAQSGADNLYQVQLDGSEWKTTFIAVLSSEDSPEWEGSDVANTSYLTARVSPDGRYLAFMSAAPITGYDNLDENSGKPDEEVFLYDSAGPSLRCVSCNPSGARPQGVLDTEDAGEGLGLLVDRREVWPGHYLAGNIPGWTAENITGALYQSRYLLNDGRLYFNSPDDLVPQATNHKEDVYEYEPTGVGSCQSSSGGCVSLISSGTSGRESAFLEATPSGSDVFFITAAQLLPQDTDTAFDIYDARECSEASPCLSPAAPVQPGCSSASACRPASPPLPAPLQPADTATVAATSGAAEAVAAKSATSAVKASKTSSKPLTRAQALASALASCKSRRSKRKRQACERRARKLYGAKTAAGTRAKRSSRDRSRAPARRSLGRSPRP